MGISDASSNTVGPDNLISGNTFDGVHIDGSGATGNTVSDNKIGTDAAGSAAIPNGIDGVSISGAPSNTVGPGNLISGNTFDGVIIDGSGATGNTITGNSIHSNTGLGINLVTGGANGGIAAPAVTAAGSASGTSSCLGCTIEVFSDDADEGEVFHGSTTTDGVTGDWSFAGAVVGPNVTATATDGSGNTSEFSAPFACTDGDGDGICDSGDPCPTGPNPRWTVPPGDDDCDGFDAADETFITTDFNDDCPDNTSDDAWPPDINNDSDVNIFDVNVLKPAFFITPLGPPYTPRVDLNADSTVDIFDVNIFKPFFFLSCTP